MRVLPLPIQADLAGSLSRRFLLGALARERRNAPCRLGERSPIATLRWRDRSSTHGTSIATCGTTMRTVTGTVWRFRRTVASSPRGLASPRVAAEAIQPLAHWVWLQAGASESASGVAVTAARGAGAALQVGGRGTPPTAWDRVGATIQVPTPIRRSCPRTWDFAERQIHWGTRRSRPEERRQLQRIWPFRTSSRNRSPAPSRPARSSRCLQLLAKDVQDRTPVKTSPLGPKLLSAASAPMSFGGLPAGLPSLRTVSLPPPGGRIADRRDDARKNPRFGGPERCLPRSGTLRALWAKS